MSVVHAHVRSKRKDVLHRNINTTPQHSTRTFPAATISILPRTSIWPSRIAQSHRIPISILALAPAAISGLALLQRLIASKLSSSLPGVSRFPPSPLFCTTAFYREQPRGARTESQHPLDPLFLVPARGPSAAKHAAGSLPEPPRTSRPF